MESGEEVYLLYLDDSGSVDNKQEQYLVLGGVCLFENQVHHVTTELDKIAASINPISPNEVEFHASEIFAARTSPWDKMKKREERQEVIKSVLRVLANSYSTARAFATVVHKGSVGSRHPMEVAFEDICTRFDLFLERPGVEARGLVILDESTHATRLVELSQQFRKLGTQWKRSIRNIVDAPLFVSSRSFRCVQLADHVAYSVFRRFEAKDANYFDVFAHRFDSVDHVFHGLRHFETGVASTCTCPACATRRVEKHIMIHTNTEM
jgi:Protein of unknown function (DUF3800)